MIGTEITLREIVAADREFLREMTYEASAEGHAVRSSFEQFTEIPLFFEGWGRPGDDGVIAVNTKGQEVGAAWRRSIPQRAIQWGEPFGVPEVALAVKPAMRGEGIGKLLLNELLDRARDDAEVSRLYLSVLERNERARHVYESAGFVVINGGRVISGESMVPALKMAILLSDRERAGATIK